METPKEQTQTRTMTPMSAQKGSNSTLLNLHSERTKPNNVSSLRVRSYIPLAKDMIRNLPKLPSSYNWADLLVWMIRVSEQITAIYMDKGKSATNTSLYGLK